MRQAIWALVIAIALVAGFLGGRFLSADRQALADLKEQVAALEQQVDRLEGGAPQASKLGRIAVVQVNQLATRYQEQNPEVKEQLEKEIARLQEELGRIRGRMEAGEISQEEATLQASELQQKLNNLLLSVVARPIQEAVTAVARAEGYDLVLKQQDVVIYYRDGAMDDITPVVWERLQPAK